MTTTCLNCGTSNHDGAKFCKGCGQSLADVGAGAQGLEMAGLSCSACGYVNRQRFNFALSAVFRWCTLRHYLSHQRHRHHERQR